jgi:hypothetical protein
MSDVASPQAGYWLMLPCYTLILWYAVSGHKIRTWRVAPGAMNQVFK